jgi:methionyl-tRNA synthetase
MQDGDFSEERFQNLVNAGLANSLGNLANRSLTLLKKNCGGQFPVSASDIPEDNPVRIAALQQVSALASTIRSCLLDWLVYCG